MQATPLLGPHTHTPEAPGPKVEKSDGERLVPPGTDDIRSATFSVPGKTNGVCDEVP